MTKKQKIEWVGCPVRYAAGVFGDKWTFVILRDALLHGKRYYGEFQNSEEGISTNILADRLAKLVETEMFSRQVDTQRKNMVCYFPTDKAKALLPAFLGIMAWSVIYDEQTEAPASFAEAFNNDPTGTVKWYEAEIDRINQNMSEKGEAV